MLIQEFLEKQATSRGDKPALVCGERRFTYAQLDAMANRLAHALCQHGVRRGDRVAIYLQNSPETVVAIFAALKADAVFVGVHRAAKAEKLAFILNDCQAAALILDARALGPQPCGRAGASTPFPGFISALDGQGNAPVDSLRCVVVCGGSAAAGGGGAHPECLGFESIQAEFPASRLCRQNIDLDLACLIYTSGTTGEPKGVMCDHGGMGFVAGAIVGYLRNRESDVLLNVLPLSFTYGLYQLLAAFHAGATLVLEESFAFPNLVVERMARERVTGFAGVPTIYSRLLALDLAGLDLSALRYLTNAAAGLPLDHVKQLRRKFPQAELFLMHGLTEVGRTMYLPPGQVETRPASSGRPLDGTELWLEDESGRRLDPGRVGELVVRGRNVMRGYWGDAKSTTERFRPGPLPGERVCYSGDLFRTDVEGYFYFVSRKDDIIKTRGQKVAPREVENVLYAIPGVREAAVVGVPDPALGQAIHAFVVAPDAGLTETRVLAHCKARLEDHMVPRRVEFRKDLPKTESGKVRKRDLRSCAA